MASAAPVRVASAAKRRRGVRFSEPAARPASIWSRDPGHAAPPEIGARASSAASSACGARPGSTDRARSTGRPHAGACRDRCPRRMPSGSARSRTLRSSRRPRAGRLRARPRRCPPSPPPRCGRGGARGCGSARQLPGRRASRRRRRRRRRVGGRGRRRARIRVSASACTTTSASTKTSTSPRAAAAARCGRAAGPCAGPARDSTISSAPSGRESASAREQSSSVGGGSVAGHDREL